MIEDTIIVCEECCGPYTRQAHPEKVAIQEDGTCPNCGRWYAILDQREN